jgi:signal transduction histidine kinase
MEKIDLRKQAEKKILDRGGAPVTGPLSREEAQRLIHELEVHQTELEMQNEELRLAQISSEVSRQRYADLYDFAPVGYFTFDRDGLIVEVNLTGAEQLKRERRLLVRRPFIVFLAAEDRTAFGLYILTLFENKGQGRLELKINGEGICFDAQLDSCMIKDVDGKWVCRTAVSNISDRKRVEREIKGLNTSLKEKTAALKETNSELQKKTGEAVEASRLKSELVANVSHELRTPLNAIIGYSQLVLGNTYGPLSQEQVFPIDRILKNAEALGGLINGLLDLAQIEAGKRSLKISPIEISSLIEEILSSMKPLFKEKGLSLTLNIQKDLLWIQSDRHKLICLLTHLLSNAIKFTLQGDITVSAFERAGEKGADISISDTGIGIRQDQLSRIFAAFHQIDGTLTREFGGIGLGLAIVKEMTRLLNGKIDVQSEYGKGSTFTLSLPDQI